MIAVLDTSAAVEVALKRESSALFTDFIAKADLVIFNGSSVLCSEGIVAFKVWPGILGYFAILKHRKGIFDEVCANAHTFSVDQYLSHGHACEVV